MPPLDVLEPTRQLPGETIELYADSGIRCGTDIATALALGAGACSIGCPCLYGLTAAGSAGVTGVIDVLAGELTRAMALLGVSTIDELKQRGSTLVRKLCCNHNSEHRASSARP